MKLRNVNERGQALEVPALGVVVEHGETVDVGDQVLAANLLEQDENWREVASSTKRGDAADKE